MFPPLQLTKVGEEKTKSERTPIDVRNPSPLLCKSSPTPPDLLLVETERQDFNRREGMGLKTNPIDEITYKSSEISKSVQEDRSRQQ